MKIAIIGGGPAGLTAAYYLASDHRVTIFEKEKSLGGLARGFKQKNWSWSLDNFFHHLFTTDTAAISLIKKLDLEKNLFFVRPKTSIYLNQQINQFDSALSVLKFPPLPLADKIRTGLATQYLRTINNWRSLEKMTAQNWLTKVYGQKSYSVLWQPLLESKFGDQADKISMVWFWARIKKRSPRLGYLEGGFQVLIDKLLEKIKAEIILNQEIKDPQEMIKDFDKLIVTAPIKQLPMLGAVNLILELKQSYLTDGTYWLNINQKNFPFVAVVEHTNLVDKKYYGGNTIVYVGGYYPQNHRYFKISKEEIFAEWQPYLKKINPNYNFRLFTVDCFLFADKYAQPIVPVNYSQIIKSLFHPEPKIYYANMQLVYPYDRGINYAIEISQKTVKIILDETVDNRPSTRTMA